MELREQLKHQIIEQLNLVDFRPEDIENDMPLFGSGLGLDSIDALELIVLLDNHYQITITNAEDGKQIFQSIDSLATYIEGQQS
ncbi:MAG TPA: acyl carrier protein [Flavobacteriales bacterium]|jgi:acyl carrier protein|nr:acyl carrier protein [Flavobacteriales bacterium]